MTRGEVRATLLVLVLVAVAVVALWPRSDDPAEDPGDAPASTAGPAAGPGVPGSGGPGSDAAAPAAARARAALSPCPAARPGPPVPALSGVVVDCLGAPGRVDLGRSLPGRTTLVSLWASWCGPCRGELPALAAYAARPGAADVLGVAVADDPAAGLELLADSGVHYPSVSDPQRVVLGRLGTAPVLPAAALVRPDGTVTALPPEVFASPEAVAGAVDTARGRVG